MAKLFGEFLVEKNLATTEQVLNAVITQLRSVSSTAEVIFDYDLLSASDQLCILANQQYAGTDFRTSAASLGLWSSELAAKVAELVQAKRRPLGEVLVEMGYLSMESLSRALELYIENLASISRDKTNELSTSFANNFSAPTSLSSETRLDPILTLEFIKTFETQICPALISLIKRLDDEKCSKEVVGLILRDILAEFFTMRAAASSLSADHLEGLAKELITTVEIASKHFEHSNNSRLDMNILRDIFKFAMHIFDGICQLLREFSSEDGIRSDPNLIDLMQRLKRSQESLVIQCSDPRRIA
jgi:hypothetical protein